MASHFSAAALRGAVARACGQPAGGDHEPVKLQHKSGTGARLAMPLHAIALGLFIHTLWGGNAVAVKWSLEAFPPLWVGFVRFVIGTAAVGAYALLLRVRLWPYPGEWRAFAVLMLVFVFQIWTMNVGFGATTGSLSTILLSLNPLFGALLARFFLSAEHLSPMRIAGMCVAFAGTAAALSPESNSGLREFMNPGNWIVIGSAVLLGARLMYSARLVRESGELRTMFWMMALSLPLFLAGAAATETIQWSHLGWRPVAGLAYQGVVIAGFCFVANSFLLRKYSPSVVVSFNFVSPIAGVALSILLLDESFTAGVALGLVLVAAGLTLVTRSR
ncbi:MAG: DMT family transporter [Pseudomonadota bacterium]